MRNERPISSIGKERLILILNSSTLRRRLPFYRRIFKFWITNQQRPESTYEYRGKARKQKGLVKNKMVGIGAKRGLCQWHRSLWSSCGVRACDQLSVALRSVESLSLFLCTQKVHSKIGQYVRPAVNTITPEIMASQPSNFLHSIVTSISRSSSKMSRIRSEFSDFR